MTDCSQSMKTNVANRLLATWGANSVIRVFLSGFIIDQTGAQNDYTLSLSNATTDGNNIYVDISKNSAVKVNNVKVGYFIYNPALLSYVLLVSDNTVRDLTGRKTSSLNPDNRTLIANQFLFGFTGFSIRGPLGISVRVDPLLNVNYGSTSPASNVNAISYTVILISRPIADYCAACPAGSQLQGLVCIICQANSSWQSGSCQCNQGYYNISGTCQQCPAGTVFTTGQCVSVCSANSAWVGGKCTCNQDYYNISGQCKQCPTGTIYKDGSCVPICPTNSQLVGGKCVCNPGLVNTSGTCQPCQTGTYLLGDRCQSICPGNSSWQNGQCLCLDGFYVIEGQCKTCPPGSFYNNGAC